MRGTRILAWAAVVAVLAGMGCAGVDSEDVLFDPGRDSGSADFSRMVAVGNSLAAGIQDGGLSETHQRRGYAALVAGQVGKLIISRGAQTAYPEEFVLPGFDDPGSPGTLVLVSLVPPTLEPVDNPGGPVNLQYPAPYHNLGIPGATVEDILTTTHSGANPFFDAVLRGQGTAVAQAVALQPTFVLLWAGANDLLHKVTQNLPVTDPTAFEASYRELVGAFDDLDVGMVIGNIPDVSTLPFATTVPPFLINPTTREPILVNGQLVPLLGPDGPLTLPGPGGPGDLVTLPALSLLAQGVGIPPPLGTGDPLPDLVVLNLAEQAEIRAGTDAINAIIETVAEEHGYPLVDFRSRYAEAMDGLHVAGVEVTTEFLVGGLIGLDGIHPNDLGHALAANAFIEAINAGYGSHIPLVDLRDVVLARSAPVPVAGEPGVFGPEWVERWERAFQPPLFAPVRERMSP